MVLEEVLAAEGIISIGLSLGILAFGIKRREALYSPEARLRLAENWSSFILAMLLFGGSLFLYLLGEAGNFAASTLPQFFEHHLHHIAEAIHMLMLILAMGISARIAMRISTSRSNP